MTEESDKNLADGGSSSHHGKRSPWKSLWIWIVLGVIVIVGTVVGIVVILPADDGDDGGTAPQSHDPEEPECVDTVTNPQTTDEPAEGEVEVTESGFTVAEPDGLSTLISFGTVLRNTTNSVAADVRVSFEATLPNGEPVEDFQEETPWKNDTHVVPYLGSGEEHGLGFAHTISADNSLEDLDLKIDVEVGEWWESDSDDHAFAAMDGELATKTSEGILDFSVRSPFCDAVGPPKAAVVYRDSAGEIIGGADFADVIAKGDGYLDQFPPGKTADLAIDDFWELEVASEEADFETLPDLKTTDIYPYVENESN